MRVFVTGGSGFVGSHVVAQLKSLGHQVIALARSHETAEQLRAEGAMTVSGHLENISEWKSALRDCDAVVHCASPIDLWGPWQKFEAHIVTASVQLLNEAADAGVKIFIHISSESALQDRAELVDIDESEPYPIRPNSNYGNAKKLAEIALLNSPKDIAVIVLRPSFVWGRGSSSLTDIAKLAQAGKFLWLDQGKGAFEAVHVRNVAEAVHGALLHGQGRSVYFVTDDEPGSVHQFFTAYFAAIGISAKIISVPARLIKWVAMALESFWTMAGIQQKPPITTFECAFLGMPRRYNIAKIKRDLGYRPVISRSQGFRELANSTGP